MSAEANAIPVKKSRSDLSRTGRPIAIDMPLLLLLFPHDGRHVAPVR